MMLTCTGLYILRNHLISLFKLNQITGSTCANDDRAQAEIRSRIMITMVEQIPVAIQDFSSQYGSNRSDSYVATNICSKPEIYPLYGDSTHALVFRTYGPWWMDLPSYQETARHFRRWEDDFTSRDFIDIAYPDPVYDCISLNVYETYNPGTIEVVYAGKEEQDGNITWHRVWTFPETFSIILGDNEEMLIENGRQTIQDLFPDSSAASSSDSSNETKQLAKMHTHHPSPPAARLPRIVKIPLKHKVPFPTRFIRLQFDHCTVNYYSEIDTVILYGNISPPDSVAIEETAPSTVPLPSISRLDDERLSSNETINEIMAERQADEDHASSDLTKLPFDLLFIICSYLDLRSLVRLSSTCRLLHTQCLHSLQFQSLNLQPYWNGITNYSIEHFFSERCSQTRHLSLAWTKSIQCSSFNQLLNICSANLVHLNLACCQYLTGQYVKIIVTYCPNLEILSLENCISLNHLDFTPLKYLQHLRSLNVYRTKIDYRTLLPLIENNKKCLENVNLGSCQKLSDTVGIIKLLFARCSNLRAIDLWRTQGLTQNGFFSIAGLPFDIGEEKRRILSLSKDEQEELALLYSSVNMPIDINCITHMKYLSEVDLGWTDPPPGFVKSFVQQVGHSLIKLFLTACRRVNNEDILAIGEHCLQLRQLDLLGSSIITETSVESILRRCEYLEFLDLSFCDKVSNDTISRWTCQYKLCFKRSYSPMMTDDLYTEFT